MDSNSREAKSQRAHRQGWGPDGFKQVEKKASDRGLGEPLSVSKPDETLRGARGHDFYPDDFNSWPDLYETDGQPGGLGEKAFVAHYFTANADWYICEYDPTTGEAFGYADLGTGHGEYGYIDLNELEQFRSFSFAGGNFPALVERDLDFASGTKANQVIDKFKPADPVANRVEDLTADERAELDAVTKKAYDFAKRVDSPFPTEASRREFSSWVSQRYLTDRSTAKATGYALAFEWTSRPKD
jgi:hypothetical protein